MLFPAFQAHSGEGGFENVGYDKKKKNDEKQSEHTSKLGIRQISLHESAPAKS